MVKVVQQQVAAVPQAGPVEAQQRAPVAAVAPLPEEREVPAAPLPRAMVVAVVVRPQVQGVPAEMPLAAQAPPVVDLQLAWAGRPTQAQAEQPAQVVEQRAVPVARLVA